MPWRCPACQLPIEHDPAEHSPRLGVTYRCHACRLELVLDEPTARFVVAPLPEDIANDQPPRRKRKSEV